MDGDNADYNLINIIYSSYKIHAQHVFNRNS